MKHCKSFTFEMDAEQDQVIQSIDLSIVIYCIMVCQRTKELVIPTSYTSWDISLTCCIRVETAAVILLFLMDMYFQNKAKHSANVRSVH